MDASSRKQDQQKRSVRKGRTRRLKMTSPAVYCIKLQGVLDDSWSETLAGMKVVVTFDDAGVPMTTLHGRVVDQAMLMGVLNCVHDLGMPLLMAQKIDMMVRKKR